MERHELSRIAHRHHRVAAPVDHDQLRLLLARLSPPSPGTAVDLGCGDGEWLLDLLRLHPGVTGVGVDLHLPTTPPTAEPDVVARVSWEEADAATWEGGPYDVVLCVGASHAFGGLAGTLHACRALMRPGGQLVLGDGFWEAPPSPRALEVLEATPDELPDLVGLVATALEHGFEPGYAHVSTAAEWDDYEWSWTGSLAEWALREAQDPNDREQALSAARQHRTEWLDGYRGELGFATLVLNALG